MNLFSLLSFTINYVAKIKGKIYGNIQGVRNTVPQYRAVRVSFQLARSKGKIKAQNVAKFYCFW